MAANHGPVVGAETPEPEVVYPANAGVLNVRDFGAKGDGATDDTDAIQKALAQGLYSHHIVYLPNGVYLVSDTLKWNNGQANNANGWGGFLQMQGQSRAKTIIRLRDNAPGFNDEAKPQAVIATGSGAGDGPKHYFNGEGNEAFENHLRDFTVETGRGNAGAMGVDFQASNCGAMRHITIQGEGSCGLSLMRRDNGPGLIKDVTIDGFEYGVRAQQELCHFTFENIQLTHQHSAGMWVRDAIFAIRQLNSQNTVPALQISGVALGNIFGSTLTGNGAARQVAAIDCTGSAPRLFTRHLTTTGYQGSIKSQGELITNANLDEWSSDDASGPLGPHAKALDLPVRDTPTWFDPNPQNWADVGAPSGGDDTTAFQAALNAGKATVYCHYGTYHIQAALRVPPTVKLIMGIGTSLDAAAKLPDDQALFVMTGGQANALTIIDRFTVGGKGSVLIEHADARTVVLRDITPFDTLIYHNQPQSGPFFVEDVSSAGYRFAPGSQVWARQWNIEGAGSPKVFNDGGTVWALGWKTEGGDTIAENRNGGRMELWAGLPYTFGVAPATAAFINANASLVTTFAGMTFVGGDNPFYSVLARDTQAGTTTEYRRNAAPARGGAVFMPLFISAPKPTGERNMQLTKIAAIAATVAASATSQAAPAPNAAPATADAPVATYKLPDFMDGEKRGSSAGNPVAMGGKLLWRLDEVWPDNILEHANYKPLTWDGQNWVASDHKFGAKRDDGGDASDALQQAIDSGATTIYLPRGGYNINKTIIIRGKVQRIIGCKAVLIPGAAITNEHPLFRLEDGMAPVVSLERINTSYGGEHTFIEHAAKRTLVLRQIGDNFGSGDAYRGVGGGSVFIEDMVGPHFVFQHQAAWTRQLNPEGFGTHVVNDGGKLWVLGLKAETGGTIVETRNGGQSEILGGLSQTNNGKVAPMFVNHDSAMSVTFAEVNNSNSPFLQFILETKGEQKKDAGNPDAGFRGFRPIMYESRFDKR